jgi:hypothetical protein
MSDKYNAIEKLLGLPEGSTTLGEDHLKPLLTKGVANKTKELIEKTNELQVLEKMPVPELVKAGFSIEELEQDKVFIRTEAFQIYDIAKKLLESYQSSLDSIVVPNDRMWTAGAKLIDSITNSLDKITNIILKFKQEEEIKGIPLMNEEDNKSKTMTPEDYNKWVEAAMSGDTE